MSESVEPTNRAAEAWEALKALQASKTLVTIVTALEVYENVAITRVGTSRDGDTGEALAIELEFNLIGALFKPGENWEVLFGARTGSTDKAFVFFTKCNGDATRRGYARSGHEEFANGVFPNGEKVRLVCQGANATVYDMDGAQIGRITNSTAIPTDTTRYCYIFDTSTGDGSRSRDNSWFHGKVYSFKIYDSTENLKFDGHPVVANGVAGLYDSVTGKFFPNADTSGGSYTSYLTVPDDFRMPADQQKFKLFHVKYLGNNQWEYPDISGIIAAYDDGYIPILERSLSAGYPQYFTCDGKGIAGVPGGNNAFDFVHRTTTIRAHKYSFESEWVWEEFSTNYATEAYVDSKIGDVESLLAAL